LSTLAVELTPDGGTNKAYLTGGAKAVGEHDTSLHIGLVHVEGTTLFRLQLGSRAVKLARDFRTEKIDLAIEATGA
jgi:hypothetical protein